MRLARNLVDRDSARIDAGQPSRAVRGMDRPGPRKCRPADLTDATAAILTALHAIEQRLLAAARTPDRFAEHDQTLSTLVQVLYGGGREGREGLVYMLDHMNARIDALETEVRALRADRGDGR